MGRVEAFASKQDLLSVIADALGMGLGYTWVLVGLAAIRELLGNGTFAGIQIMPASYEPILFFILPPGGFFVFSLFISLNIWLKKKMEAAARRKELVSKKEADIMDLGKILLLSMLVNNIVVMRFIALCSYIGMTSDLGQSMGMGYAVTFVTVLATAATWPIYHYILLPLDLAFLQILVFILVIASLVQLVEFYLKKNIPGLYAAMGIYLPLITTNCAICAVTFENITNNYNFIQSIVYAIGVSLGYLLAMILLAGIRDRMKTSPVPKFLQGTPILFMATSLIGIAFMGFAGLIK